MNNRNKHTGTGSWRWGVACDDRGMALLITIMIISLLIVVTLEFGKSMRQHHMAAANLKSGEQLGAIARSGVAIAKVLLEQDAQAASFDSLLDNWARVEQADFSKLFTHGNLKLTIADLSGRVQINSLVKSGAVGTRTREILIHLLNSGEFAIEDGTEAEAIVDSFIDWLDTDDLEMESGAENSYYQSLSPAYACKNAAAQFIEELMLVKGVTPALLYGLADKKPLMRYITVYGDDGKINLNTAESEVLQAMNPQVTRELADGMDEFRRDKEHKELLANPNWYTDVPSWPIDVVFDPTTVTTTSAYFWVEATGTFDTLQRKIAAAVSRADQGEITELIRKVE